MSITHNVPKLLLKGYQGEPKVILQVLWERGLIDPSKTRIYYAMKGTQENNHNIRPKSFLFELMVNCIEFEKENKLLQSKVLEMRDCKCHFFLDHSPKCHYKLAGGGN